MEKISSNYSILSPPFDDYKHSAKMNTVSAGYNVAEAELNKKVLKLIKTLKNEKLNSQPVVQVKINLL